MVRHFVLGNSLAGVTLLTSGFAAAQAAVHKVAIKDMQFVPKTVDAKVGDEIVWTNEDIVPHTATSKVFDSKTIASAKSWTHKVKKAGTFDYKCSFHPTMTGSVTAAKAP